MLYIHIVVLESSILQNSSAEAEVMAIKQIDFRSPVILYYGSFQGDTSVVVLFDLCLGVKKFLTFGALCLFSYFC